MAGPLAPIDNDLADASDNSLQVQDSATFTQGPDDIEKMLNPDGELHRKLLGRCTSRINMSARFRAQRYDDWDRVDEHMRLFINLNRKMRFADKTMDPVKKENPFKRAIVMPVSYAIFQVRVAQMMSLYLSQSPVIRLQGRSPQSIPSSKWMEAMLAYDADRTSLPLVLHGMFGDAEKYGEGTVYDTWDVVRGNKRNPPPLQAISQVSPVLAMIASKLMPSLAQPKVDYNVPIREHNRLANVDPQLYFPDPRVPVTRTQDMEFCGHLTFSGRMNLIANSTKFGGPYFNLQYLNRGGAQEAREYARSRVRERLNSEAFGIRDQDNAKNFFALDHQQIKLIPREWGIGPQDVPVIWWLTVSNEAVIIRAHESSYDHGEFTYATCESNPDPHPVVNAGTIENLDGLQRVCDWFMNSRIANVRKMVNNSYVYNPAWIEAADMENLGPGRHVRYTQEGLRMLMSGQLTPDQMMPQQLQVQDVTGTHAEMFNMLFDLAQRMGAASDPSMGAPTPEQKTLGEIQSMLAASSQRIAMLAKTMDAQAFTPFVYRMIQNRQQFTTMDQYYRIEGADQGDDPSAGLQMIGRDDVQGDYDYIPNSGVLPPDPGRQAQTWLQLLQMLLQPGTPLMMPKQNGTIPDIHGVFEETVRQMGIRDLSEFYTLAQPPQVVPDAQALAGAQAGNLQPVPPGNGSPMPPGVQ